MNRPVFATLEGGEVQLDDPAEFYWRQCSPGYLDNGVPSIQMFAESTGDGGKLSGTRSTKATAQAAYEERLAQGRPTVGTWGLTVAEIEVAGTRAVDDSSLSPDLPTGHTYIDYRHLVDSDRPTRRGVRSALHKAAVAHGRQWPPSDSQR